MHKLFTTKLHINFFLYLHKLSKEYAVTSQWKWKTSRKSEGKWKWKIPGGNAYFGNKQQGGTVSSMLA